MKNFLKWNSLSVLTATLILGCIAACQTYAQPSPVGTTWDFVLQGNRTGTAYFDFYDDGTFSGYEVLVPNNPIKQTQDSGRGDTTSTRGGSTSGTNSLNGQQIFGSGPVSGPWSFDNKGHVIGYFIETSTLESCKTNPFPLFTNATYTSSSTPSPVTNLDNICGDNTFVVIGYPIATNVSVDATNYTEIDACFTNYVVCSAITNAISFVGTVSPGKRFVLKCTTPFGTTVYKGVPAQLLTDLSGNYYATRKQNGVVYNEFLTLTPSSKPFPNIYDVDLTGPGYSYSGHSVVSSQRRISFSLGLTPQLPTDPVTVVRAVSGPFNAKSLSASTIGWDQPSGELLNPERFNVYRLP